MLGGYKVKHDFIMNIKNISLRKEENKIKSPYTKEYKQKKDYRQFIYILGGVILIAIIVYLIIALLEKEPVHKVQNQVHISAF